MAFAATFLLNVLRSKFAHLLLEQQANTTISLVEQLIQVLNEAAIDETHMARSYAKFLSSLLDKHRLVQEGETAAAHGTSSGVQYDPSVQGFLSQYSQCAHPHMGDPEGQGLYGTGPGIHITGQQDVVQSLCDADTDSSACSITERFIQDSDLWPSPLASLPDYGIKDNGGSIPRLAFEREFAWQTANEPNVRPPNLYAQL